MTIDRLRRPISFPTLLGLAVLVMACGTPRPSGSALPGPSVTAEAATPTPVAIASESPGWAGPPCTAADLELSHSPPDGAAGSRFAYLEFLVVGAAACSLPAVPTIALVDSTGARVLIGTPAGEIATVTFAPGTAYQSVVQFNNWCEAVTAEPLTLVVLVGDVPLPVSGGPFPNPGQLPPCMGPGDPLLESSPWGIPPG